MTITLTSEIESAIAEQAQREGTTPERVALDGLRNLFVTAKLAPDDILGLAAQVYNGLPDKDRAEVEQIALDRSHFSGERSVC